MATYHLKPSRATVRGSFSPHYEPVLRILPGDTVVFETADAGWGSWWEGEEDTRGEVVRIAKDDPQQDAGPALCGPVFIEGARPGRLLQVTIRRLRTASWGFCAAGGWSSEVNDFLDLSDPADHVFTKWRLDPDEGIAEDERGLRIRMRPFLGTMGMPLAAPALQSAIPPRLTGGNFDCRELTEGSVLYLPIAVEGGLFFAGDGHAVQGDGEVSGTGLETPMQVAELSFDSLESEGIDYPWANTPRGLITFGFDEDLDRAALLALRSMVDLLGRQFDLAKKDAVVYASLTVNLAISQIVNGVKAVHAILPHGTLEKPKNRKTEKFKI